MAVRLEATIKRWVGLSTDVKPAINGVRPEGGAYGTTDVPAGSSYLESDTGRIWRYDGINWTDHVPVDDSLLLMQEMLVELRGIAAAVKGLE